MGEMEEESFLEEKSRSTVTWILVFSGSVQDPSVNSVEDHKMIYDCSLRDIPASDDRIGKKRCERFCIVSSSKQKFRRI